MDIVAAKWKGWNILAIQGDFVVQYLVRVRKYLETFSHLKNPKVAIDLTNATYVDSSAITLMLNYNRRLMSLNGVAVVCGTSKDVKDIFAIVGFERGVKVFETREQFKAAVLF